jgi:hypothetical protein
MVRPIVLVFQEFATLTTTPTTPDLNCLITGPAYQLQDYPDDKADIQVSDYGTLNADNPYIPPVAFVPTITLAEPPNLVAGAWVDPTSVVVYFDEARVIMESGTDGVTLLNDNLLTSASATFITNGVQAGDTLIIDNPAGPPTPNLILTISSVDSETTLRVTTNFIAAAAALNYRVERELSDQLVDDVFVSTPVFATSNEIAILGGVTLVVGTTARTVAYAQVYVEYRAFRTDLQNIDTVDTVTDIETKIGRIDARNPLSVGTFVAKQNAGDAPVQFYGVPSQDLVGYNTVKDSISTDNSVYAIVPLITDTSVIAAFKTDNETLADPNNALNTGVLQRFRVVIGSADLPISAVLTEETPTATTEQLTGAIPPGTKRITIASLTALTTNLRPGDNLILSASENVAPLDGTYTIAHINSNIEVELNEALPVVVGVAEGINYRVIRPSTNATLIALVDNRATLTVTAVTYKSIVAGVTPGARTIALVQDATTPGGIQSIVEVVGVSTVINGDWAAATLTAQNVVDALNTGAGVTITFTGSVNLVASTTVPATLQVAFAATALSTGTPGIDDLTSTAALDAVFIKLFDSAATFITDGVIPGDLIEIPETPNGVFSTNTKRFTVNQVLSEQRLQITNVVSGFYQNNTSTLENELPHLDNRLGAGALVTQGTMRYRVTRQLTKDQQVTQLVSVSQSLNSRRALMAWPNKLVVAGLVDNSKPKNPDGSSAAADPQPGYYGAAVVGGMTAGLPSHQGFSRIGIAGISRIFNSNDYFSEAQLTDLSDGGWYVFTQATPISLPFSIHQLTTDPSTLQSGEYSIVKNFDFVSLFFVDILNPFIGIWNINNDTVGFIRQAVNTGIDNLKLRRVARIGAPINDASITSLDISTASADRIELFMEVDLPVPLNVIGLHLVA